MNGNSLNMILALIEHGDILNALQMLQRCISSPSDLNFVMSSLSHHIRSGSSLPVMQLVCALVNMRPFFTRDQWPARVCPLVAACESRNCDLVSVLLRPGYETNVHNSFNLVGALEVLIHDEMTEEVDYILFLLRRELSPEVRTQAISSFVLASQERSDHLLFILGSLCPEEDHDTFTRLVASRGFQVINRHEDVIMLDA